MIYVDKDMNIDTYIDMYMCVSPQRLSLSVLLNRVLLKRFFFSHGITVKTTFFLIFMFLYFKRRHL